MDGDSMSKLLEVVNTLFTGGILSAAVIIAWRSARWVEWVKESFNRNDGAHVEILNRINKLERTVRNGGRSDEGD